MSMSVCTEIIASLSGAASVQVCADVVGHEGAVWGVAWSPSGQALASCGWDRIIRLWKQQGGEWKLTDELRGAHNRTIRSLAFSPDGRRLAAAGFDGIVSVWVQGAGSGGGWSCAASLEGHENEVKSVCWSPDGRLLATCGRDKTVWIWEVNGGDEDATAADDDLDFECLAVLAEHTQDVKMVAFHPFDSNTLVSASYDETVKVWRAEADSDSDWDCRQTLSEHSSTVWSAAFSPTGHYLVSVGDDQRIVVYKRDGREYRPVETVECAHARPITSLDVRMQAVRDVEELTGDAAGKEALTIATAGGDRQIKLWTFVPDEGTLEHIGSVSIAGRIALNDCRWNPRRPDLLAVAAEDGCVYLVRVGDAE